MERPPAATIPDAPGSYQFLDAEGRVVYVGKAKSLRSRVGSYFQNPAQLTPRTAQMVGAAATVVAADTFLTRDRGFYTTYFPELQ